MPFEKSLDEPAAPLAPICRHLRSKAMYVTGTREPSSLDRGTGHCWCNLTQNVRGPDALIVDRRACNANRSCYQAVL